MLEHREDLTCIIPNRDLSVFAIGTASGHVEFWNAAFSQQLGTWFDGEAVPVRTLSTSPHEQLFCLKGEALHSLSWPGREGDMNQIKFSHQFQLLIAWSPDGQRAILTGRDGDLSCHLWNASRRTTKLSPGYLASADWSSDGALLATVGHDGTVHLCDGNTLVEESTWIADHRGATDGRFSPDSRTLATAGAMGDIKLWNVATGRELLRLEIGVDERCNLLGLSFSPNGRALAASTHLDGRREVWLWPLP